MLKLELSRVSWPMRTPFRISRITETRTDGLHLVLTDAAGRRGRGEAIGVDYAGETQATMIAQLEAVRERIEAGPTLADAQGLLPSGGARNALDCALWDLQAKRSGVPAWRTAGLNGCQPVETAYTCGMMDEAALRQMARDHADHGWIKVKTDRDHGLDPVRIIHEELPHARLIVDPNEAWGEAELRRFAGALEGLNVALLEQPVAAHDDEALRGLDLPVPVAADEAFDDLQNLATLAGKYQVLNIKLDKTGGLTEALACARAGLAQGFRLMIGCMAGSSLSMAPAVLVAQLCDFVDLDGPLLQTGDVADPVIYLNGRIGPPTSTLWG
jgi:L-Ala-D/L-Glu epimerase